jgi:hypothetical protein
MSERSPAELILAHQERLDQELEMVPDHIPMPELVDGVIRGKYKLDPMQLRVLVAWMPHFAPKLSATANVTVDGSFAERLERCLERSQGPVRMNGSKTIDHEELVSASELKKPFPSYRRF